MKEFDIKIKETLEKTVTVEAENREEAEEMVRQSYFDGEHILDAEDGGLLAAMSDDYDLSKAGAGLGEVWEILNMDVKPYPCCRSIHCIIDGVLKIRDKMMEKGLSAEELREMRVYTYQVGFKQCAVSEGCLNPRSPLDAKFSSPYGAAAALLFGKVTRQEYEPSVIEDPRVKALIRKIRG